MTRITIVALHIHHALFSSVLILSKCLLLTIWDITNLIRLSFTGMFEGHSNFYKGIPQARKASLALFLEKRKQRLAVVHGVIFRLVVSKLLLLKLKLLSVHAE